MKQKKLICPYCNCVVEILHTSNHTIGCNLEAVADVLRFRSEEKLANQLDEIASRIK
jgi:hypothetical protein